MSNPIMTADDCRLVLEWSGKIHKWAVEKGWWQEGAERPVLAIQNNFFSEVAEAWEEYRAGRMGIWFSIDGQPIDMDVQGKAVLRQTGRTAKPEGFWVEIADLVIRLLDTGCVWGWFPASACFPTDPQLYFPEPARFVWWLFNRGLPGWSLGNGLVAREVITACVGTARLAGVNLWELVELKHCYNGTRPYRHGGKLA